MRTIILVLVAGIVGSAATGIVSSHITRISEQDLLTAFSRTQNTDPDKLLPHVSKSIVVCGSSIPPDSPSFRLYTKAAAVILGRLGELRANRGDAAAQGEQKDYIARQMFKELKGVSETEFRIVATELLALSKDRDKQDCIIRTSLAEVTKV